MIEQFARVLAKALFNKKAGNYSEAVNELESSFNKLIAFDYNTLAPMSDSEIISLLTLSKESAAAKCIIAAKLFKERTAILEITSGDKAETEKGYRRSFNLFVEAMLNDDDTYYNEFEGYYSDIDAVIDKLDTFSFPFELKYKLFRFYEMTGDYAGAEDELFRLKKMDFDRIKEEGIRFYNDLKELSDTELSEGNFSIVEVMEGLEDFLEEQ
jgi:hypothetical protein